MKVRLNLSAHLRSAAGRGEMEIALPGSARVADAIVAAAREAGARLAEAVLDPHGKPRDALLLFVNDEQTTHAGTLSDGDDVTVIAPISGG